MAPVSLDALAGYFNSLTPGRLDELGHYYAEDAWFRDPFNEVRGLPAIRAIYEDMYRRLCDPRFRVSGQFAGNDGAVLLWEFEFALREGGRRHVIKGASHLRLDASGRIRSHRDYWDAAELYATVPVLGLAMRWLRRRAAHGG
jgi:hypothetical protein